MLNLTVINQSSKLFVVPLLLFGNKIMARPEMGMDMDDLEIEDGIEVEDVITAVQQECSEAINTPENSVTLNEIFDLARATYEKDPKNWDLLFEDLKSGLEKSSDDDDEVADILDQYKRKAALLG